MFGISHYSDSSILAPPLSRRILHFIAMFLPILWLPFRFLLFKKHFALALIIPFQCHYDATYTRDSSIFIAQRVLLHNIVWYLVVQHVFIILFFDIPIKCSRKKQSVLHHTHQNEMGTSLHFLEWSTYANCVVSSYSCCYFYYASSSHGKKILVHEKKSLQPRNEPWEGSLLCERVSHLTPRRFLMGARTSG